MLENISLILLERVSLILVITYITFQSYFIKNIFGKTLVAKNRLVLGIIGGFLGILGTVFGIRYNGAIVNYRDIGVIFAGMLGGIPAGLIAALISSIFRLFLGGITVIPCFLGTITAGIISGFISHLYGRKHFTFFRTLIYTVLIEITHLTYVLVMVKPYSLAFDITFKILFPMVITNSLGVSFLNYMIKNIEDQLEQTAENTINSIFIIMEKSLSSIEEGFNEKNAKLIADTILNNTNFDAVAITDKNKILAHVGIGSDHHVAGMNIQTNATKKVIESGNGLKVVGKKGISCSVHNCPLYSGIIIPLTDLNNELIGTLKLYYSKKGEIKNSDIIFGKKLAQTLSLIISLARIYESLKLATEEKLRELMSNLSPHFLFNTLNAIKYISKKEPDKVNYFIDNISELLRYTLYENKKFVSLKDEIKFTTNYLELMKLRYKDKLSYEITVNVENTIKIPPFILQPLVENSIKHGMKENDLIIKVKVENIDNYVKIYVEDNGKGFKSPNKKGKGLDLIQKRLNSIYGEDYSFSIKNGIFAGTTVEIKIKSSSIKVGDAVL